MRILLLFATMFFSGVIFAISTDQVAGQVAGGFDPNQAAFSPDLVLKVPAVIPGETYIVCEDKDLRNALRWQWDEKQEKCIEVVGTVS